MRKSRPRQMLGFAPSKHLGQKLKGCPTATKVCDLMALLFAFDEYTDNAPPDVVRRYADVVMDAVRNSVKPRPNDEVVLGVISQEYSYSCLCVRLILINDYRFWALGVKSASNTSQKHFVESFEEFVYALVQEAEDRQRCHIRNVEDYFNIRRLTFGAYMVHAMLELSYDLPDKVFNHPPFLALRHLGRDLMVLDNALEDCPHNIVVCVMKELKCDLHDAISWVENLHRSTRNKFLTSWTEIPSWGPEIDSLASHYLHGIANWVRAGECWNFESERYFGSNGKAVQQHRMVTLMPKQLLASEPLLIHTYQSA
ncbi:uncharacterized protein ARMOST_19991 [Armillaria ostoyae]|uniref:Terpene synthase n=1 Tax=Armillaria ostoyae TaxID=47428 RepID=A0A284S640_ARMOS|nr:uncharacterized protein ARMOST_19991 [Armillaria ostoyae]